MDLLKWGLMFDWIWLVLFMGLLLVGSSQVVGWPPIRAYRMNSLVSQAKVPNVEEEKTFGGDEDKSKENFQKKVNHGSNKNEVHCQEIKGHIGFVKVNMDGLQIGRKVDLNAHACYETLAQALEEMFFGPTTNINSIRKFPSCYIFMLIQQGIQSFIAQ